MDRIQTSTKAVDKFGPGKHGFTAGNPATGTPATQLSEIFFDSVQEEICAVIEAAGIALDPNNRAQLLAALRSSGVFQTAALGDASTKVATTEFVQRALGSFAGIASKTGTATLTASDVGKVINMSTTSAGQVLTLPLASTVPAGGGIFIECQSTYPVTVQRQGADSLSANGGSLTAVTLEPGDELLAISSGTAWLLAGSATLRYSDQFDATLAAAGYQKLPSGLIIQWGSAACPASSGAAVAITFPIAFPTGYLGAYATVSTSAGVTSTQTAWVDSPTSTGMNLHSNYTAGTIFYVVIGR